MKQTLLSCYHDPKGKAKKVYIKVADYVPYCHPENQHSNELGNREYFKNETTLYAEQLIKEDKILKKKSKGKYRKL